MDMPTVQRRQLYDILVAQKDYEKKEMEKSSKGNKPKGDLRTPRRNP